MVRALAEEMDPTPLIEEHFGRLIDTLHENRTKETTFGDFLGLIMTDVTGTHAEQPVRQAFLGFQPGPPPRLRGEEKVSTSSRGRGLSSALLSRATSYSVVADEHVQDDDDMNGILSEQRLLSFALRLGYPLTDKQYGTLIEELRLKDAFPLSLVKIREVIQWCDELMRRLDEKEQRRIMRERGRNVPVKKSTLERQAELKVLCASLPL